MISIIVDIINHIVLTLLKFIMLLICFYSSYMLLYLTIYYYIYRENEDRLILLETLKEPYLFTSSNLEKIVNITVSLKTRMSMIGLIGPRLTDPNAKISTFTDMFRFSEEKKSVEDILKARTNTLNASQFKRCGSSIEHYIIIQWDEGYDDKCHHEILFLMMIMIMIHDNSMRGYVEA